MGDCNEEISIEGGVLKCGGHADWDDGGLHQGGGWFGTRRIEVRWMTKIDTDKVEG